MTQANQKQSLATKRAIERGYDSKSADWMIEFESSPLKGDFAFEEGVIRRDPTSVISVDGAVSYTHLTLPTIYSV